jgi:hypothetical protein
VSYSNIQNVRHTFKRYCARKSKSYTCEITIIARVRKTARDINGGFDEENAAHPVNTAEDDKIILSRVWSRKNKGKSLSNQILRRVRISPR